MKSQIEMTMKEVLDIVAAVFEYNQKPVKALGIYDTETNAPVPPEKLIIVAESEAPNLRVRVAPEGNYSEQLRGMTTELLNQVRKGG